MLQSFILIRSLGLDLQKHFFLTSGFTKAWQMALPNSQPQHLKSKLSQILLPLRMRRRSFGSSSP
jgi:hypothetical protein